MSRFLLLVGFVAHVCVGSSCFANVAFAQLDDDGTAMVGEMSMKNAVTCPVTGKKSINVTSDESSGGGCPDGQCWKAQVQDVSGSAAQTMDDGSGFPVAFDAIDVFHGTEDGCVAPIIDDPPIPPGIEGVVMRN